MQDDPVDLTSLDPDTEAGAEERFVGSVMTRIAATPNPYPMRVDVLWGASSLVRPVLLAASIAIVVAGIVLVRDARDESGAPRTVAESVGMPMEFRGLVVPGPGAPAR